MQNFDYLPEFTPPTSDDESNLSDHNDKKSTGKAKGVPSEIEVTLGDKLQLLDKNKKPKNVYRNWDRRQIAIHDRVQQTFKKAPQNIIEKAVEKMPPIDRQLERTERQLARLLEIGAELISNINIDQEKREFYRRENDFQRKCDLGKTLRLASIESAANFDEITNKWFELQNFTKAQDLYEELENQTKRITDLMEMKDNMINQCQAEMTRINATYAAEQDRQARDLRCMAERINGQIDLMKKAYKAHLNLLEDTIAEEREHLQVSFAQKLNNLFDTMGDDRGRKIRMIRDKKIFYAKEMERIRREQQEVTQVTRIQLEKNVELLQLQLQHAKNRALMASELLDYNDQVLKKRHDENGIINNEQKRRISQLNEEILKLKKSLSNAEANMMDQNRKLSNDIQKLHTTIVDMERKALHFRKSRESRYHKVFAFSYREVADHLARVCEVDKILYEQLLHMPWTMPDYSLEKLNAEAHIPSTFPAFKIIQDTHKSINKKASDVSRTTNENKMDIQFLKTILGRISDRSGFIIEEKLLKLLQPYSDQQKQFVRIENIFQALKIKNTAVLRSLTAAFEPYAWCPNCSDGLSAETLKKFFKTSKPVPDMCSNANKTEKQKSKIKVDCGNHQLVMEPSLVLIALDDFTRQQENKNKPIKDDEKTGSPLMLNSETGKQFWRTFYTFFPKNKEVIWQNLEHGLNHYLKALQERVQLDKECENLRRQNTELKYLLQKFEA